MLVQAEETVLTEEIEPSSQRGRLVNSRIVIHVLDEFFFSTGDYRQCFPTRRENRCDFCIKRMLRISHCKPDAHGECCGTSVRDYMFKVTLCVEAEDLSRWVIDRLCFIILYILHFSILNAAQFF